MRRTDEMCRADVRRNSGGRVLLICGFGTGDADEMERTYGKLVEDVAGDKENSWRHVLAEAEYGPKRAAAIHFCREL